MLSTLGLPLTSSYFPLVPSAPVASANPLSTDLPDIFQGKPTRSNQYGNCAPEPECLPSRANDGSDSTAWKIRYVDTNTFWEVDLGSPTTVYKIRILQQDAQYATSVDIYGIVPPNGNSNQDFHTMLLMDNVSIGSGWNDIVLPEPMGFRYYWVQMQTWTPQDPNNVPYVYIRTIQGFGERSLPAPPGDVFKGKPSDGSCVGSFCYNSPDRANDGLPGTQWNSPQTNNFWTVDTGSATAISKLRIYQAPTYGGYATSLLIRGSNTSGCAHNTYSTIVNNVSAGRGWTEVTLPGAAYRCYWVTGNTFAGGGNWQVQSIEGYTGDFPQGHEYRGGGSSLTSDPCNECGQPINTVTGNLYHTFTDLTLPGRSFPLQFSRTYNAEDASKNGVLGYGWTHSYNWYIDRDQANNYLVHEGNGAIVVFASDFSHPQRIMGTLANVNGDLVLTRHHGRDRFYFTLAGSIYRLYKVVDRNGYNTTLSYNTSGLLQTVTEPAGRTLAFTYTNAKLTTVYDSTGNRTVQFGYNSTTGDLTSAIDVANKTTSFTYDNHLLRTWTNPAGGVVTNDYASSKVIKQTDEVGRTLHFEYSAPATNGVVTTRITNTLGLVSKHFYANNMLIRTIEQVGQKQAVTDFTYQLGTTKVATVKDPNGQVWSYTWDSQGNLLTATDPLNRSVAFAYNVTNDLTVITNPRGLTTTFTYDTNGNPLTVSRPYTEGNVSAVSQLQYNPTYPGQVMTVTTPIGTKWTYGYNSVGLLTSVANHYNQKTQVAYTSAGWPQKITTPRNYSSQVMQFNAYGDPLVISDTRGYTTTLTYDNDRNRKTVTDANYRTTTYTYTLGGQVTRVTTPDGTHSNYGYDGLGRVITQTNNLGQLTSYTYDDLNNRATVTGPLTRTQTVLFDLAGNPTVVTDTVGRTTTLGYDNAYQLRSMTYSDGVTPNVSYNYNSLGARTAMTDGTGTTTYTYDSLDRLKSVTNGNARTVSYGYDLANRQTSITYPNSQTVTREYDGANRLSMLTSWQYGANFEYDADGNLIYMITGNGDEIESIYNYDPAGNLQGAIQYLGGDNFLHLTYTRDKVGNVSGINDSQDVNRSYSYDARYRLTQDVYADQDNTVQTWGYDAGTRMTTETAGNTNSYGPTTTQLSYDSFNQLTSLWENEPTAWEDPIELRDLTFDYSPLGNRIQQNGTVAGQTLQPEAANYSYAYDQANRMTNFNGQVQYKYNGDGLRMSKVQGSTTEHFTWDVSTGVPLLIEDATAYYIYGPDGKIFEAIHKNQSQSRYTYFKDHLGSVRSIVGPTGQVVATYNYDAYGNVTSSTGTVTNRFRYTGEYTDPETGFVYLRARYYDPETRQFTTVDPALALTDQPYAYVRGNPTNFRDPRGLWAVGWCTGGSIAGIFGIGASECWVVVGDGLEVKDVVKQQTVSTQWGINVGIAAGPGIMGSNATEVRQLEGRSSGPGGSLGSTAVPVGGAIDAATAMSTDANGCEVEIRTATVSVQAGIGTPLEVHHSENGTVTTWSLSETVQGVAGGIKRAQFWWEHESPWANPWSYMPYP